MKNGCGNCKYEPLDSNKRPCSKCAWDDEKGYSRWKPMDRKDIKFPILNGLRPTVESCTMKLLEEIGETMQLIGKGQGKSGEPEIMTKLKWASLTVCESIDTAQSAITLAHTLCKEYNLDLEELMELHESKLKSKGYLK